MIWNDHILFQKFQGYVSNEISENEYLSFLKKSNLKEINIYPYIVATSKVGFLSRYKTEAKDLDNHWKN